MNSQSNQAPGPGSPPNLSLSLSLTLLCVRTRTALRCGGRALQVPAPLGGRELGA